MKKLLLLLLLIGAALIGIVVWLNLPRSLTTSEKTFTYAAVQKGTMTEAVSATGVLEPRELLWIVPKVSGTVIEVRGEVNDAVGPGRLLVTLDDQWHWLKWEEAALGIEVAEAAVAQAQAQRDAAQVHLKTQKELQEKGGFRADVEVAEAQLKGADKAVDRAKAELERARNVELQAREAYEATNVQVPTFGKEVSVPAQRQYLILERKVTMGQMVGPHSPPLFVLSGDLKQLRVIAQVAEGDIGKVKKGLGAVFTVTAYSDADIEFHGTVKEIRPSPANVKGAIFYETVIEVANDLDKETGEWRLRPGMTAAVDIVRRRHKDVWKVPTAALNFRLEDAYQGDAARERLAEWKKRPDQANWQAVWIWDADHGRPWPIFVRIGGLKNGGPGLKDSEFNEVLEWEPGREPTAAAPLRLIINAPPARNPGLFDRPADLKLS